MKYLSLNTYFDLQKQRIFFIKSVLKKKQKTKFIYLFSKRKASLLYVKPLYLDFQNIIHFNKSSGSCKQNNLYLRGLTGLPLNNVYIRYKYFDFNNVFDRIKFKERYNFEIFSDLRQGFNKTKLIKVSPILTKKKNFFFFVNIAYSLKNQKLRSIRYNKNNKKINKNILKYNVKLATLLTSCTALKNIKFYLIFFKAAYQKYLTYLNFKFTNLKFKLLKLTTYYLYTIDLFITLLQKTTQNIKLNLVNTKLVFVKSKLKSLCSIKRTKKLLKKHVFFFNNFYYQKKQHVLGFRYCHKSILSNNRIFNCFAKYKYKSLYLYLNNINNFVVKMSYFFKNKIFLSAKLLILFRTYQISFKKLKKKQNLFFFSFLKKKTLKNYNTSSNFFFKNFVLYNVKYFKKYWKYFFKYKFNNNFLVKKKIKKNQMSANYFCGFSVNKSTLNHVYSLYYFFSLLLNKKHWFYYYKTYMPILQFKHISNSNLDVNFKVRFFSWFKKNKLYVNYKNKLCFLNYKNKYVYLYFYNYLYFKQLAGLKYITILNKLYLSNFAFFWNDYKYIYVDLTLQDIYAVPSNKNLISINNLKNTRLNLIKNYLNVNIKFKPNVFVNLLYDFSINTFNIFLHNINYKFITVLKDLQKNKQIFDLKNNIYISNKNTIFLYFYFKLLGQNLKKISFLKYIYFKYIVKKEIFLTMEVFALKVNSKFIFDFFFLLYSNYFSLIKLIILLLRYTL